MLPSRISASTSAPTATATSPASASSSYQRRALGSLLGALVWLWMRTLRVRLVFPVTANDRAWVLCFFHGKQVPLFAWARRRNTVALVSHSKDGDLQAASLRVLGIGVVRGSSSRGGAEGLRALIHSVKAGSDAAMAVDGPRGPLHEVKGGSLTLARAANAHVVPVGTATSNSIRISAWDEMRLPLPFSKVAIVFSEPIEADGVSPSVLRELIVAANERAEKLVA